MNYLKYHTKNAYFVNKTQHFICVDRSSNDAQVSKLLTRHPECNEGPPTLATCYGQEILRYTQDDVSLEMMCVFTREPMRLTAQEHGVVNRPTQPEALVMPVYVGLI